jgi:hypothetical protein
MGNISFGRGLCTKLDRGVLAFAFTQNPESLFCRCKRSIQVVQWFIVLELRCTSRRGFFHSGNMQDSLLCVPSALSFVVSRLARSFSVLHLRHGIDTATSLGLLE